MKETGLRLSSCVGSERGEITGDFGAWPISSFLSLLQRHTGCCSNGKKGAVWSGANDQDNDHSRWLLEFLDHLILSFLPSMFWLQFKLLALHLASSWVSLTQGPTMVLLFSPKAQITRFQIIHRWPREVNMTIHETSQYQKMMWPLLRSRGACDGFPSSD